MAPPYSGAQGREGLPEPPDGPDCKDVVVKIRAATMLLIALSAPVVAACSGNQEIATPTACLEGPAKLGKALDSAPQPVRINGRIPISTCLIADQPNADLIEFGSAAVDVATGLSAEARRPGVPGIAAAIKAGYLVGAVERGSEETEGIHAALVDRIRNAATNGVNRSGSAMSHYEIGYEAGRELG